METIIEVTGKLVLQEQTRDWCRFPYPGHPKGCPNYNIKKGCPPNVPIISSKFDLNKPHYVAVVSFDLAEHMKKMALKHPGWSERQQRCCLYWQGKVRKKLRILCENWLKEHKGYSHSSCPEAMGLNVFRTAYKVGIKIRKSAYPIVYKVALLAQPL
jgi:predicted metal-binding protein